MKKTRTAAALVMALGLTVAGTGTATAEPHLLATVLQHNDPYLSDRGVDQLRQFTRNVCKRMKAGKVSKRDVTTKSVAASIKKSYGLTTTYANINEVTTALRSHCL